MAQWVENYSLEAPEGHRWERPAPEDCARFPCHTARVCHAPALSRAYWEWIGASSRIRAPLLLRGPIPRKAWGSHWLFQSLRRSSKLVTPARANAGAVIATIVVQYVAQVLFSARTSFPSCSAIQASRTGGPKNRATIIIAVGQGRVSLLSYPREFTYFRDREKPIATPGMSHTAEWFSPDFFPLPCSLSPEFAISRPLSSKPSSDRVYPSWPATGG